MSLAIQRAHGCGAGLDYDYVDYDPKCKMKCSGKKCCARHLQFDTFLTFNAQVQMLAIVCLACLVQGIDINVETWQGTVAESRITNPI